MYYSSTISTSNVNWESFTHLSVTAGVSSTSCSTGDIIEISAASSAGTLSGSSNEYTYYVSDGTTTYRVGTEDTTSTSVLWEASSSGTWSVYVTVKDEYGLETAVSSAKTVTVS
ncbi:MAG: hypothetical protein LUF33_07990 [Clostridiales bacterium]|nr:hypothetical protein [Clostridiales bacterium]